MPSLPLPRLLSFLFSPLLSRLTLGIYAESPSSASLSPLSCLTLGIYAESPSYRVIRRIPLTLSTRKIKFFYFYLTENLHFSFFCCIFALDFLLIRKGGKNRVLIVLDFITKNTL